MREVSKFNKQYSEIEDLTYRNILEDLLKEGSKEVLRERTNLETLSVIHYKSCTIQFSYSDRHSLNLNVYGEKELASYVINSIDKIIEHYDKKNRGSSGPHKR